MQQTNREPGPGRPPHSSEKQDLFRKKIEGIARDLFAEEGFESVSIRRIATRAGCAPMTLYRYFQNKRDLIRHIWEDIFIAVFQRCAEAMAGESQPAASLLAFARSYLAYWLENPSHYRVIFLNQDEIAASEGSEQENYYVESSDIVARFSVLREHMEAGIGSGLFREQDPELMTQQFLCTLQGVAFCLIMIPEYRWRDSELLVSATIETLLTGFSMDAADV